MKSYDETIRTVFDRIDAYETGLEKRRKILGKVTVSLGCICLIALLGFLLIPSNEDPLPPGSLQVPTLDPPPVKVDLDILYWENTVVVNPIDKISAETDFIALHRDDYISMTEEEINAYFGMNIVPHVPEDLERELTYAGSTVHYGIYRRDQGAGDVYFDSQQLIWVDGHYGNFTRRVAIEVYKDGLPLPCYSLIGEKYQPSTVKNVTVLLGQDPEGMYLAEMMYGDVCFRMYIVGLSQEEIISIIESLIP